MAQLKIAVIGAGSFVFGTGMLQQAIVEAGMRGIDACLEAHTDMLPYYQ